MVNSLPKNTTIVCSTEFFVLRAKSDISYLAPFLLTSVAQDILCASQEGGHHPRFTSETLENLSVDISCIFEDNSEISETFKKAILNLRMGEQSILKLLCSLNKAQ